MALKIEDLYKLKEFKTIGEELMWCVGNLDEYMEIRVKETAEGNAEITYTDEYVMGGNSREKVTTDKRVFDIMN